jgi:predicted SAM-dependent methyltransferase
MKLNVGCGPHYAEGWVNVDVTQSDEHNIHPDVLVEAGAPLPFDADSFDLVYLGHVLEHVPWDQVHKLVEDVARVVKPGGRIGIVGPDSKRTLDMWRRGEAPDWLVDAVLEDDVAYMTPGQWDGARHQWNCHEARVLLLLERHGYQARPLVLTDSADMGDWPLVSDVAWQFGVEVQVP